MSNYANPETPVTVIVGNYRPALAVARRLKAIGHRVVLAAEEGSVGAERSRAVDRVVTFPAADDGQKAFAAAMRSLLRSDRTIGTILPIRERTLDLVESIRSELPSHIRIAAPSGGVLAVCHDKYAWLGLCRDAGIPTPRFATASTLADLRRIVADIGCPVVIRPVEAGKRIGKWKAVTIHRADDFSSLLPVWPAGLSGLLVQKQFVGERFNLYFGAVDGRIVRELHSKSLRTDRWDGTGQTIEGAVVDPIAAHSEMLATVARSLNYTGVGCAQFLLDPDSGMACFLEINPRFGASHAFVERAGFDLTRLALELAEHEPQPTTLTRPVRRLRFVWTYGDLSGLVFSLRNRDIGIGHALHWAWAAIRAAITADVHVTWSWRDPAPTLRFYTSQLVKFARGRQGIATSDADIRASTRA